MVCNNVDDCISTALNIYGQCARCRSQSDSTRITRKERGRRYNLINRETDTAIFFLFSFSVSSI